MLKRHAKMIKLLLIQFEGRSVYVQALQGQYWQSKLFIIMLSRECIWVSSIKDTHNDLSWRIKRTQQNMEFMIRGKT